MGTIKAANGIIKNYLMPHDVSGMTEEQHRNALQNGWVWNRQSKIIKSSLHEGNLCDGDF